ncbi:MAG: hypothetical protein IJZ51_07730 [Ruminiclostridium sp.]|nr:hypothetical protein [Ruminiclostridium sp.]
MIKKTLDNYSLSDKQKDELFQRIENSLNPSSAEQVEKEEKKRSFLKYASVAAAVLVVTGVTALVVHLTSKGEPINVSTPQSSTTQSDENDSQSGNSSDSDNSGSDTNPLHENPSVLPFYKDSTVMDMEPQPHNYEGLAKVRFAEESYSGYNFTVAGNFIRREENLYEAQFYLYVTTKDNEEISVPGEFVLDYAYKRLTFTRESLESLSENLISVIPMTENGKTYPVIALTIPDDSGFYDSFYYEYFKDEGFKTITSFFVADDGMGYKLSGLSELSEWYPDFDSKNITVDGNVITDSKDWKIKFDFENKTVFADAVLYDEEGQKTKDNLLSFDDSNIMEYDGELSYASDIPYRKVLLDEKTCGEYTFTLFGRFITYTEKPDHYYGYYGLIVSRNGKVIKNNGLIAVDIDSQGRLYTPKDYNYKDMLKVYTMTQNGIDYPLASVTYNITNEDIANSYAKSVTRFFTVRNGTQDSFTDGTTNYKNLPTDVTVDSLSITDNVNCKKITFDFVEREATIIMLYEKDVDIKKRPYFKNSHIYTEPYGNAKGNYYDIVRFAEKSYNNYDFIVGGKMEPENEGLFKLTLYMYLYQDGKLIDICQMSPGLFGNFRFQLSDVDSFEDNVLEVRTVHSQGKEYPLAAITCKVDAKQLKSYFGVDFSTITDFFMITDNKLNNVIDRYPDYVPGTAITNNVMTDDKNWVTEFDFENGCARVDRILLSPSNQKIKDNLVPFTDDNIPVYNGAPALSDNVPYATVFIDEKTVGKYTFTLFGNFIKSENYPDNYYGYFDIIISRDGKAIRDYIGKVISKNGERVIAIPKSYDFSNMLKAYSMMQNGIEFPLAVVTYGNPDIYTGENGDSISGFFTVNNGFGEDFISDYSGLSSDIRAAGLSIIDDANKKKITFDFLKMKSDVSSMDNEKDIDVRQLPYYKDSAVFKDDGTAVGETDLVRFAEKSYEEYRFVVAGSFIRREEDRYEAKFSLYIYKDEKLISAPCSFDLKGYQYAFDITKADMEQFDNKLMKIHTVWQDNKAYPLIALTNRVDKQVLSDLFYSEDYEYGTIFFSVKDDQAFRFTLNGNFNFCYPDFEMDSFSRNVCTDKNGWVTQFDFENKTAYVDAVLYDDEKQELLNSLLPFEDSSIPVYDGSLFESSKVPYADVLVEEKIIGDYTFTLAGRFIRRSDDTDNYFGGFRLIVSKNGKAIKGPFIATVDYGAQFGVSAPKNYNYNDMLKCYMMKQNGIEYPLATVTYNIPEEDTRESLGADSLTRFFTVRNGVSEPLEGVINYKNLSPNAIKSGLSLKDSANRKRITFDFENRKATVTEITDPQHIDVRECLYYKDSAIYKDGSTAVGETDFVRYAEKEYICTGKSDDKYKFIVGGELTRLENGNFNTTLYIYFYVNDNYTGMEKSICNGGYDFSISAEDIEGFGDTVLDLREFKYFGTAFPLAVVTAKPCDDILEQIFPTAGFSTISGFYTAKSRTTPASNIQICRFNYVDTFYPDYTKNATFRVSENDSGTTVMVDEKGWEVFFNPETRTAHVTEDKTNN